MMTESPVVNRHPRLPAGIGHGPCPAHAVRAAGHILVTHTIFHPVSRPCRHPQNAPPPPPKAPAKRPQSRRPSAVALATR